MLPGREPADEPAKIHPVAGTFWDYHAYAKVEGECDAPGGAPVNCPSCSAPVEGQFCSRCGARVPPPAPVGFQPPPPPHTPPPAYAIPGQPYAYPPVPYTSRVQSHVKTLGILWWVYSGYRLLTGIAAFVFLLGMRNSSFMDRFNPDHSFPFGSFAPMMGGIAALVLVLSIGSAALACLTGFALVNRKPWGRTLAIVAGVLALIKIPAGTALGIYTLWVLAPGHCGMEYNAIADHS